MLRIIFLTFIMKCVINGMHKMFKQHLLTMFGKCLKMFYKYLIANSFLCQLTVILL